MNINKSLKLNEVCYDIRGPILNKVQELEKIADLTVDEAKDIVIREAEDDAKHELTVRYRNLEEEARNEANEKARFCNGKNSFISKYYINKYTFKVVLKKGDDNYILVTYSDVLYDPDDTINYNL